VKVTRTISIGNAVVLNEADYLDYLMHDEDTPAIAMYLEGVREGRRFFELLREATLTKPVIIWRGGRTSSGARAVQSHTGSLASNDAVWEGLVRQTGVISTRSIDETVDAIAAVVHNPPSSRRGLGLIAMTGGQSVAISDQFEGAGFSVPPLSQRSYDRLGEFFMTIGGSYRNPFDAASTIGRETENLGKILEILAEDEAIDGGVAIELGARGFDEHPERVEAMLDRLDHYRTETGLPVVAMMPSGGAMGDAEETMVRARRAVAQRGFPIYPNFAQGAAAFALIADFYAWRESI
jgi:acyl-CoA synthetase (NDP forming)